MTAPCSSATLASSPHTREAAPVSTSKSLVQCHALLSQQLNAYYERTKLLAVVRDFMRELTQRFAAQRLVPLNPYVPLLSHIRQAEINAQELVATPRPRDSKAFPTVQELLISGCPNDRRTAPIDRQIATFKPQPAFTTDALAVWGLRGVLERIPYSASWQRGADAIHQICEVWLHEHATTDEACSVFSFGAVVGAGVFFMGNHRDGEPVRIDIERQIVVHGDVLELAMAVFARQQIRTLFEITKKNAHMAVADGSHVALLASSGIEIFTPEQSGRQKRNASSMWTLDQISVNRQAFVTAVKMALVAYGSFSVELAYEHRVVVATNCDGETIANRLVRLRVEFVFHFESANSTKSSASAAVSSLSFVRHSRADHSGIFWTTRAAHEITRRISEQRDRDASEAKTIKSPVRTVRELEGSVIDLLLSSVRRLTRSSGEMRFWLAQLLPSTAFRLASIAALLATTLHIVRSLDSTSDVDVYRLLRPALLVFEADMHELVQDASVGRASSLLHGLPGVLKELCTLPTENSLDSRYLDLLYHRLQQSQEVVLWLATAASRDFCRLLECSTNGSGDIDLAPSADLRPDIAEAIDQRQFPPAIVAETVFAQYLIETRLDVALERSMVSTVTSGLPPNPFVVLCGRLKVFAAQFLDAHRPESQVENEVLAIRTVPRCGFAIDVAQPAQPSVKVLVSANERLLKSISVSRMLSIHRFLIEHHVYRTGPFHPSNAAFSGRSFTSLLVDHPLFTVLADQLESPLMQSIEVIEHVAIQGRELDQALECFADAVRRDVARLVANHPESIELRLLDPSGELLTTVELSEVHVLERLVVEATRKQCTLCVVLPPTVTTDHLDKEPLVRRPTKSYVFHHLATDATCTMSERLRSRLHAFGVFTDVDVARLVLDATGDRPAHGHKATQTEYVARAVRRGDTFSLNFLKEITGDGRVTSMDHPRSVQLLRLLDTETALQWLLNRLVFQQQTILTPRSESAALVSDARAVLDRAATAVQNHVVPLVEVFGTVDAVRVVDALEATRSFCEQRADADCDQLALTAERLTRHLLALVLLVRFALQAHSM